MTDAVAPPHLRAWENFCGSQKKGSRRYRRIVQPQLGQTPTRSTLRRHWSHPAQQLPLKNSGPDRREVHEGEAKESSSLSIAALVQAKSGVLQPVRKCIRRRLEQEAQAAQYVVYQPIISAVLPSPPTVIARSSQP
jgi:hypothetical protein